MVDSIRSGSEAMEARAPERIFGEGDPNLPAELHDLLVRVLTKHLENSTNPNYHALLNRLWNACMTLSPTEEEKVPLAHLMAEEVEHGVITAQILRGLGVDKVDSRIDQYLFDLPIETWCDLCFFHALGDRVGMYVGENWGDVPYEPLRKVAPKLHRDEIGHATLGYRNLQRLCRSPQGLEEANELIQKWWPAALDMFGSSDSRFSEKYVRWGIRKKGNAELRQDYIRDVRPMLESIGIRVPDENANRRFL